MISEAITSLKHDDHGSLRQAVLKYVQDTYSLTQPGFRALFNNAVRKGVEQGRFRQPKGPLGPILLVNKDKKSVASKTRAATAAKRPRSSSMSKASKPSRTTTRDNKPVATPRRALTGKIKDQSKLTEKVKAKTATKLKLPPKANGTKAKEPKEAAKSKTKDTTTTKAKPTKAKAKTAPKLSRSTKAASTRKLTRVSA